MRENRPPPPHCALAEKAAAGAFSPATGRFAFQFAAHKAAHLHMKTGAGAELTADVFANCKTHT